LERKPENNILGTMS